MAFNPSGEDWSADSNEPQFVLDTNKEEPLLTSAELAIFASSPCVIGNPPLEEKWHGIMDQTEAFLLDIKSRRRCHGMVHVHENQGNRGPVPTSFQQGPVRTTRTHAGSAQMGAQPQDPLEVHLGFGSLATQPGVGFNWFKEPSCSPFHLVTYFSHQGKEGWRFGNYWLLFHQQGTKTPRIGSKAVLGSLHFILV